jgi:phosphopantothenoylcysteine synthetase/decarboxylase
MHGTLAIRSIEVKKNLLIGFTGSVASILYEKICKSFYKEYNVKVVMTESSRQFVNDTVLNDMEIKVFSDYDEFYEPINFVNSTEMVLRLDNKNGRYCNKNDPILHIQLRDWADCLLIAPCSANTLAKISNGICDNLLTSIVRAWDFSLKKQLPCNSNKKIIIAPAANCKMWCHPITQEHIDKIGKWGICVIDPVEKKLACGETGIGAMADISTIVHTVKQYFSNETEQ